MTVYLIADIKITDPTWVEGYAARVHEIVHRHGGTYLSRSGRIDTKEGEPSDSTLVALISFPTSAAFDAFAGDPEYAPFGAARQAGSRSRFTLIDDSDLAGTIPYLAAG